ncbi:HD-GYP domain-containing protein [Paenisporosarcina cavernae]|uniref:HD-GYP domain-containing protein n=1 Tax=Paenisporosarcina cavernae TaxID=2320858 RepID=A0A385YTH3_9BACL|nr:HD-GYP domain-containing protein [Paenisporosarcina cavernae]AYC29976.1 HD-GYP domain-containing protein [Paenisporosarcina cavernae]
MRLISLKAISSGMVLGRSIRNDAGHALLQENIALTDAMINRLRELEVQYVYIHDELSKGIEIPELIPFEKRHASIKTIKETFREINPTNLKKSSYVIDQQSKQLFQMVDEVMGQLLVQDDLMMILGDVVLYDSYIFQHSFQVMLYSIQIAKELGYSYEEIRTIGMGALLHDVGKMVISSDILFKKDKLDEEEYELVKKHARVGFDILRGVHSISLKIAHCAFQHHERLDGSGYPRNLLDFEIHPYAKIIAVADVFDAVTSDRVYKEKMLPNIGLDVIRAGKGTLFDPKIVDALCRVISPYPNGTMVLLSDGSKGIVTKQNQQDPSNPVLRIFEKSGQMLQATFVSDLNENRELHIIQVITDYNAEK